MAPSKVMIIRHGEKPGQDGAPGGVDIGGVPDKESLTVQGWQRAGALSQYFSERNARLEALGLAVPDVIFASDDHMHPGHMHAGPDGSKRGSKSRRNVQTVMPLAAKLGRRIDQRFSKGEEAGLFEAVMACAGAVLICWQHEQIPAIAHRFVPIPGEVPQSWPEDRYDVVWVLDPVGGGWWFRQVLQRLLAGDGEEPIGVVEGR